MTETTPYVRDDVKAFLAIIAAINGPKLADQTLEEARAGYLALHTMGDRPARELAVIKDLTCPGPGGDIPLRLYDARETRGAGPVMVFYHGGGFVIGDLETHHNLCTELAAEMDLPLIAVDYRCAPEHPFPAAVDDCEAATRWIAASPEAIGREVTGVIPIGDSAGGTASIVVSQQLAANPAATPVVLQVPIFPLASDSAGSASLTDFADGYVLTKDAVEFFAEQYQPDLTDPRGIPILGDQSGTPHTVLVTAGLDPIRDSGRDYGAALSNAGISHIHLEMHGATHSFTNLRQAVPSYQQDLERMIAAMKLMLETSA